MTTLYEAMSAGTTLSPTPLWLDAAAAPNLIQYDATSSGGIPLDPALVNTAAKARAANVAVAAYNDREFAPDFNECLAKYSELGKIGRVRRIASTFATVAEWIDYEQGNPCYGNPDGVAEWVLSMLDEHDVWMPGAYANQSDMPALQAAYVRHKVPRAKTTLWLAAPGHNPSPFLSEGFDLVQDRFAGPFDVSVAKAHVYPPVQAPKPTPKPKVKHPSGTARYVLAHKFGSQEWTVHHVPGTGHAGSEDYFDSAEVQINAKTLKARARHLGENAKPLGGK